jgi:hypothetical protein
VFVLVNIFCVNIFFIIFCTVLSIVLLYVRSHTQACVRTHSCVFKRRGPHHRHTFNTNTIECTLVRSITLVLNPHVTLFRSPSPLLPLISHLRCTPISSIFLTYPTYLNPKTPKAHHLFTSVHPPPHRLHQSHITPISTFSPFLPHSLTQPQLLPNFSLVPIFKDQKAHTHPRVVPLCCLCWIFHFLLGVGLDFRGVLQILVLRVAHHMFDIIPQRVPACLGGKFQLLGPLGPKPW